MGRKARESLFEIDYMLETILLKSSGYLLFSLGYITKTKFRSLQIDVNKSAKRFFKLDSENNNHKGEAAVGRFYPGIQSAGNFLDRSGRRPLEPRAQSARGLSPIEEKEINRGSSETIRQLSSEKFKSWLAGIIDGDGNFDLRGPSKKLTLKSIRIKLHVRDIKILNIIQNHFHFGRIKHLNNNTYCMFIVSKKEDMAVIINLINGLIRLKVSSFKKACDCLNIKFLEPNYTLEPYDPYFSGLIDTDGSIVFNYKGNRIECGLELKYNEYSKKLVIDYVIPDYKPSVMLREKKSKNQSTKETGKVFKSIYFKYQTVSGMIHLYEFFMKNRLYCDMKFYRVSKIKRFLEIRHYQNKEKDTLEFKIYSEFLLDFIKYLNPKWTKVPFVQQLRR